MGRMKHGKPNPHNDNRKVVKKEDGGKNEKKKKVDDENKDTKENRNYVPEEYRKRKLASNHDRYDEPIDNYDDVDDFVDETKNLDYIKSHYSGVSSHFQFEDEKEWQNEETITETEEDLLQLNLHKLATELCDVNIFDKLNLKEVDDSVKYCIEDLQEFSSVSKTSTNLQNTQSQTKLSTKSYVWSDKGLGNQKTEHKTLRKRELVTPVTGTDQIKKADSPTPAPTTTSRSSSLPSDVKEMVDQPENDMADNGKSVDLSQNSVVEYKDDLDLDDLLDAPSTLDGKEIGVEDNGKAVAVTETTIVDCEETDDFDLDDLLEAAPASVNATSSEDTGVKESHVKESGAKELDDWLDSILD